MTSYYVNVSAAKALENESDLIYLGAYINRSKVLLYPFEKRRCSLVLIVMACSVYVEEVSAATGRATNNLRAK